MRECCDFPPLAASRADALNWREAASGYQAANGVFCAQLLEKSLRTNPVCLPAIAHPATLPPISKFRSIEAEGAGG